MKNINVDDQQYIYHLYKDEKKQIYEIATQYNQYTYYDIYRFLLLSDMKNIAIEERKEFENEVCNIYVNNHISQEGIGEIFGMTRVQIKYILRKHNIYIDDKSINAYEMDINYFDLIDTSNKAYILGLLAADGCLSSNYNYSIQLSLQEQDVEILEKIHQEIGATQKLYKIFPKNGKPQYKLILQNKHMYYSLIDKGITPKKSLTLKYPSCIPYEFQKDFIRGYLDGDGTITSIKSKIAVQVQILGTESFLLTMSEIIKDQTGICFHMYKCKDLTQTKIIGISGNNQTKVFLDWLYSSNALKLKRKYDKYIKYFYNKNLDKSTIG